MKVIRILAIALLIILLGLTIFWVIDYLALFKSNEDIDLSVVISDTPSVENNNTELMVQEIASDLYVPWSVVYTDESRILVTERSGNIRVIQNGELLTEPLISFPEVSTEAEEGLMGLAVDPNYDSGDNYLYACYAYNDNGSLVDKVVKIEDSLNSAEVIEVLIDDIPAAKYHAGCEVKFGPDGYLYITTGDAVEKELAQDLDSLAGKILRINKDGSVPDDNPFPNSPIYSYGHRNPQGIDWDKEAGIMFSTEHGPSVFDGPAGGDEINVIKAGANYGWPVVSHENSEEGMEDPKLVFTPAVAPGSAMVYSGSMFPEYKGDLFFGGLRGEGLFRVIFDKTNVEEVLGYEKLEIVDFGRIREVTEAPDGSIIFVTSNRDGRGGLNEGDDKIYRLYRN